MSKSIFVNEPYRLFFPLGILAAAIGIGYWIFVYFLIANYNPVFHGLFQTQIFGAAFAIGFLMTAIPKFTATNLASLGEVAIALILYGATALMLLMGEFSYGQYCFLAMMLWVSLFAARRVKNRKHNLPPSFVLVGFGFINAICGSALLLNPFSSHSLLGLQLVEQGMLLSLTLGVGAFLGPRLMGVSEVELKGIGATVPPIKFPIFRDPKLVPLITAVVVFLSYWIGAAGGFEKLAGLLRAIFATWHIWCFGVLATPRSKTLVGWVVALGLWVTLLGLWLVPFTTNDQIGINHVTFIGGFALLIVAIGSQVTSSHAGQPEFWKINRRKMIIVFVAIIFSLVLRVSAARIPNHYLEIIFVSSLFFLGALASWSLLVLPLLGQKKTV